MARPKKKQILITVAVVAVIAALIYYITHHGRVTTDDAAIDSYVVAIAPKVSGYVQVLNVTDNQHVKKNDVILQIDPTDYQLAVNSAQASLDSANASWENSKTNLKRYQNGVKGAFSKQQIDDVVAQEKVERAHVATAAAQLAIAAENLRNTAIYAPFDGRITERGVERGAYVQPGQQLLAIVSNDYWVTANYKETQLDNMKPGQPVDIEIDAYPGQHYKGKVDSIQHGTGARFSAFPPENATGNFVKIVQRVPVKIVFTEKPDPKFAIGPGMSVDPTVDVR